MTALIIALINLLVAPSNLEGATTNCTATATRITLDSSEIGDQHPVPYSRYITVQFHNSVAASHAYRSLNNGE
jgi:hypothetical protein